MTFPVAASAARAARRGPTTLRALLAVAFALTAILGPAGAPAPAAAADGASFIILIDGLCTAMPAGADVPGNFAGPQGLATRLRAAGVPAERIAAYSYRGGTVDAAGAWHADAYTCLDSSDHTLAADGRVLDAQVAAMAAAHPGAAFHLVGFSQGGLVAFAWLAQLAEADAWALPAGARLASVTTLDSPLGGLPFVDVLCTVSPGTCGGSTLVPTGSSLADLAAIWNTGLAEPAGADRSISGVVTGRAVTNQSLAADAAQHHGISVLTVGNVRDWLYAPAGPGMGGLTFLDTQWLTTNPAGAGVHARAITSGPTACPSPSALGDAYGCNHALVVRDPAVAEAVLAVTGGGTPALAPTCPAGAGGCLALPPREITIIRSDIAAGIVRSGGTFGTGAVLVPAGGRATVRFATSPAIPGAHLQVWARSRTGSYHLLTTRVADASGVVRYYTPPVTAWTAFQARYAGDYVNGTGVSPGRVATVR